MACIYQYVNKLNGHMYIGLTKNLQRRHNDHCQAAKNPNSRDYNLTFHKALRKYGPENFDLNILEDNLPDDDISYLKQREIYWIEKFNTYNDRQHYNETPGGDLPGKNTIHLGEEHGMAKLSEEDVIFCRKEYQKGSRSRGIYNQYFKDKIHYGGFLRMWHGQTWKHIMPETFDYNPHRAKYGAADRDIISELYQESGLNMRAFVKTEECYVGYGTLWNMINHPEFYDNK